MKTKFVSTPYFSTNPNKEKKNTFNRDSGRVGEKKAISSLIKRNFVAVSNILVKKCGA